MTKVKTVTAIQIRKTSDNTEYPSKEFFSGPLIRSVAYNSLNGKEIIFNVLIEQYLFKRDPLRS